MHVCILQGNAIFTCNSQLRFWQLANYVGLLIQAQIGDDTRSSAMADGPRDVLLSIEKKLAIDE